MPLPIKSLEQLRKEQRDCLEGQGFVEQPNGEWRSEFFTARITDCPGMTGAEARAVGIPTKDGDDEYNCLVIEYRSNEIAA